MRTTPPSVRISRSFMLVDDLVDVHGPQAQVALAAEAEKALGQRRAALAA